MTQNTSEPISELRRECERESENCLYTSTSLLIWLRVLRYIRGFFIVVPLSLGSLASWQVLNEKSALFTALLAFLAGLLPTIYAALKFDDYLTLCRQLAGDFKNLQDRFRQAALITSKGPFHEFEKAFEQLMKQLESARSHSFTAPGWCFRRAQEKIKKGDYSFDVDLPSKGET